MRTYAYMTSLALAVAGVSLTGCDREDTVIDDTSRQTEVSRDMERTGDQLARDTERGMEDMGDRARQAGEELKEGARDLGDGARDLGRDARDAVTNTGNELDRAGDRTAENLDEAGRDVNRNLNDTSRNVRVDGARDGVVAPNGTAAAPDAEGIRDILAQVPEATLTEDGFDDLVERFVDADRNRIGQWLENNDDFADLNRKAAQLSQKYQAKYQAEFDIADEGKVFTDRFATITQSEISEAQAAAARDDGDANRDDAGRNTAMVKIAASHGLPELTVNMLHEMPGMWKIDLPDRVSGQQLHDNVGKALDRLAADESKWPDNAEEAQRYITHALLLAVHGQDVK